MDRVLTFCFFFWSMCSGHWCGIGIAQRLRSDNTWLLLYSKRTHKQYVCYWNQTNILLLYLLCGPKKTSNGKKLNFVQCRIDHAGWSTLMASCIKVKNKPSQFVKIHLWLAAAVSRPSFSSWPLGIVSKVLENVLVFRIIRRLYYTCTYTRTYIKGIYIINPYIYCRYSCVNVHRTKADRRRWERWSMKTVGV